MKHFEPVTKVKVAKAESSEGKSWELVRHCSVRGGFTKCTLPLPEWIVEGKS